MAQPKVLVVDDNKYLVELMRYNLQQDGMAVIEAFDGKQAIEKALSEKPNLIILDINMPVKDGFEVCRVLRMDPKTLMIPIIIASSRKEEYDRLTGFEIGADDYITKPFKVEELVNRVKALLRGGVNASAGRSLKPRSQEKPLASFGCPQLDSLFKGGVVSGSNVVLIGPVGTGKSSICRRFMASGLKNKEAGLYVSVEDTIDSIKRALQSLMGSIDEYISGGLFRLVNAVEANILKSTDINEALKVVVEAGIEIGQSIQSKKGGRRVVDSLSGLLSNFDELVGRNYLSQIIHTSNAFGGVTTIYTLEEGTISPQQSTVIKSYMDGVIELKNESAGVYAQVINMKWGEVSKNRIKLWSHV